MNPVPSVLTLEEAQSLCTRLAAIVSEHTRLQEEVLQMRLILSELASLRALLHDDDAPARALLPGLNGHVAAPLPPPEAPPASYDPFPQCQITPGIETSDEPQSNPATAPPHGYGLEETDVGESPLDQVQTGDETPTQPHPDQAAGPIADTGDCPSAQIDGTTVPSPDKTETIASLPPSLARVLEVLENSARPKRPWQIAKALGISRPPSSELSKLVALGRLVRIRPAIYGLADRAYPDYEAHDTDMEEGG